MQEIAKCGLCGEPMPEGEEMFKFHGYSGACPKPPMPPRLQPHEQRVVAEKADLDEKLNRLRAFIDGDVFVGLDGAEKDRLRRQAVYMGAYSAVLGDRIDAFGG